VAKVSPSEKLWALYTFGMMFQILTFPFVFGGLNLNHLIHSCVIFLFGSYAIIKVGTLPTVFNLPDIRIDILYDCNSKHQHMYSFLAPTSIFWWIHWGYHRLGFTKKYILITKKEGSMWGLNSMNGQVAFESVNELSFFPTFSISNCLGYLCSLRKDTVTICGDSWSSIHTIRIPQEQSVTQLQPILKPTIILVEEEYEKYRKIWNETSRVETGEAVSEESPGNSVLLTDEERKFYLGIVQKEINEEIKPPLLVEETEMENELIQSLIQNGHNLSFPTEEITALSLEEKKRRYLNILDEVEALELTLQKIEVGIDFTKIKEEELPTQLQILRRLYGGMKDQTTHSLIMKCWESGREGILFPSGDRNDP